MPSLAHEAPLPVLREEPALVPTLLRESLGVIVPSFTTAEVADAALTQVVPAELRADLIVELRGPPPDRPVVIAVVVEIQRSRDDDKWRSWPLYVASLHARLRCPTCLVVIATDDATARWAATPIATLQPGSPFIPLVLGPERIPRVPYDRARHEPWMAVLSGLVHGNRTDGAAATLAAMAALSALPDHHANVCYDLIRASLNDAARRDLEDQMQPGTYEYQSDFARRYFGEGRQEGRQEGLIDGLRTFLVTLADRHGAVSDDVRARIDACGDAEQLQALGLEIASAPDRATVERVLARLPSPAPVA